MQKKLGDLAQDRICDAYLANWNQERRCEIEDYVRQVDSSFWPELRVRLLRLDIRQLVEQGLVSDPTLYKDCGEEVYVEAKRLLENIDATQEIHLTSLYKDNAKIQVSPRSNRREIIGPYKLLEQIGEGGMGSVWLAEQEQPVRRRVALKLIRADLGSRETIARFEAERQALAMMDHQNIAKVLDAGTRDDGSPYFVMELVKGIPFTDYCDRNQLNVEERLRLFIPVCNAVQHAHQKGIIHRDLKPSNVLVTLYDGKPVPKVIDFGLAKATEHTTKLTDKTMFTEFGKVVGTLQYMAPEQAEMNALDVDTRTDVYALGAMLYEILTGSTPLDRETMGKHALLQILTIILEKEPPLPSSRLSSSGDAITGISNQRKITPHKLRQILRGELDWIVMKALEKDRTRRYDSASSLAMDIERFLNNDIVAARPPSSAYRLKKQLGQLRRNPIAASVVGIVLATCILIPVTFAWVSHNARVIKQTAEANRLIELLQDENTAKVDSTIDELEPYWDRVAPNIEELQRSANPKTKLHAELAEARYGVTDRVYLKERLLMGNADEVPLVVQALMKADPLLKDEFWSIVNPVDTKASVQRQQLLGAAAFLAKLDSKNEKWSTAANPLANAIIASRSFEELSAWGQIFEPVGSLLTNGFLSAFDKSLKNKDGVLATRAAELLASYSTDNQLLADLLTRCDPQAFEIVFNRLSGNPTEAKRALQDILRDNPRQQRLRERQNRLSSPITSELQAELESAQGFATADFAYCQTLPVGQFEILNQKLERAGYRLQKLRPYPVKLEVRIAAVWRPGESSVVYSLNEPSRKIQRKHAECFEKGYKAIDVAGYDSGGERFSAVWHAANFEHTEIHLGLSGDELDALWNEYNTYIKTVHSYQKQPGIIEFGSAAKDFSRYSVIVSSYEGEGCGWSRPLYQVQSISLAKNLLDISFCSSRFPLAYTQNSFKIREPLINFSRLTNPKDIGAREGAWQVQFGLSNYKAAYDDLTVIIDHHRAQLNTRISRTIDGFLGHRAIASAYMGDERSSNADLAELSEGWWRHFFIGYCQAIFKKFDNVTEEVDKLLSYDLSGLERFNAAIVYAVAAHFAATDDPQLSNDLRKRALDELARCSWVDLPVNLQLETLAKNLREMPGFDDFVSKHGLDQSYCFIESYSPAVESECVLNSSPLDSMARHSKLISEDYWPVSITCHSVGDRVVSSSIWHRERIKQEELEQWSSQQVRAMVALVRLGFTDDVLPHLDVKGDPRLRTKFVHEARAYGISSPEWIMPMLLREELTPSQAIALLQYLGLYQPAELAAPLCQQLSEQVSKFAKYSHPGVHGSAIWLQRAWKIETLNAMSGGNVPTSIAQPYWNQQPHVGEMIVLPPGEFMSGSIAVNDPDIETSQTSEKVDLLSIPYQFALSAYPVTVAQYDRFLSELKDQRVSSSIELQKWLDDQEKRRRFTRAIVLTEDSPVTKVGIDAVYRFCNWLSQKSGIPEEQWCYVTNPLSFELTPVENQSSLTGFRLPTGAEWEYACRAGTTTRRYYGYGDEFLGHYAWFIDNSGDHVWPVGMKKPNDWGFFDMYGNVWEVCEGQSSRGGDYDGPSYWMRSSYSSKEANAVNHEGTGFRVARTLSLPDAERR